MIFKEKIKYALATSMALLMLVLIFAFINMRITIADSNRETVVLGTIKNIEAIQLNAEHLERLKDMYLKSGNENYLREYDAVSGKIKNDKNALIAY